MCLRYITTSFCIIAFFFFFFFLEHARKFIQLMQWCPLMITAAGLWRVECATVNIFRSSEFYTIIQQALASSGGSVESNRAESDLLYWLWESEAATLSFHYFIFNGLHYQTSPSVILLATLTDYTCLSLGLLQMIITFFCLVSFVHFCNICPQTSFYSYFYVLLIDKSFSTHTHLLPQTTAQTHNKKSSLVPVHGNNWHFVGNIYSGVSETSNMNNGVNI